MARNPAPEFPVRTYPSPNIADQVVIEFVTTELANSKPLNPGTAHPNTREFAGFKLGIQRVNPADPYFVQRLWVRDETDPDLWNFSVKYLAESVGHPTYIRSYRELKSSYTARVKGSADPDFNDALLIAEEAQQYPQDSEFFALYFNVMRVYQVLPGPELQGQEWDRKYGVAIPYIIQETLAGSNIGAVGTEITPIDSVRQREKRIDMTALLAVIETIVLPIPTTTNVYVPDELVGIDAFYNRASGEGVGADSSSASGAGGTYFAKAESSSSSRTSASIMPDVIPRIVERQGRDRPAMRYTIYVVVQATPALTRAEIINRLETYTGDTVADVPKWRTEPVYLMLNGERRSVDGKSNHSESSSGSSDGGAGSGSGSGASIDIDTASPVGSKTISGTVHGEILVTNPTAAESTGSCTANASVVPDTIPATSETEIPSSGLALIRANGEFFVSDGTTTIAMVDAEVIDWSDV